MKLSPITLADLFVCLALVFLIQIVIALEMPSSPAERVERSRLVVYRFGQVQSLGSEADHMRYVAIGRHIIFLQPMTRIDPENGRPFNVTGCWANFMSPADIRSRLTADNVCVPTQPIAFPNQFTTTTAFAERVRLFTDAVSTEFGLDVTIQQGEGVQSAVSIAFDPDTVSISDLPAVRIGMCQCRLQWDGVTPLEITSHEQPEFPHPLIVQQTLLVNGEAERHGILSYFYFGFVDTAPEGTLAIAAGQPIRLLAGSSFSSDNCTIPPGANVRDFVIKDVHVVLTDEPLADEQLA